MRVSIAAFTVSLVFCLGCSSPEGDSASPVQPTGGNSVGPGSEQQSVVEFEVRDFRLEKNEGDTWVTWSGRGNLVTKAAEAQGTTLIVFLEARNMNDGDQRPTQMSVVVRDGIGVVEAWSGGSEPPKYEWRIHGWLPLNQAKVKTDVRPES